MMDGILVLFELAQEEAAAEEQLPHPHAERIYEERLDPVTKISDKKFVKRYRISKETFHWLLGVIENDLMPATDKNHALTPAQQLSVALRFYARASFQMDIGDMCGVSQATTCRAIHRVTAAICARRRDFMHFPVTPEERRAAAEGFYQIAGYPGVVGAIDGNHIAIAHPHGDRALRYMCRKGYYSINTQLTVDHQLLFTNIVARWYCSAHDSRIFKESELFRKFRTGEYQGILLTVVIRPTRAGHSC
jgi:hypothetical protein